VRIKPANLFRRPRAHILSAAGEPATLRIEGMVCDI